MWSPLQDFVYTLLNCIIVIASLSQAYPTIRSIAPFATNHLTSQLIDSLFSGCRSTSQDLIYAILNCIIVIASLSQAYPTIGAITPFATNLLTSQLIGLIQRASWPISRNGASPCSTASSSPS